MQKNFLNFDKKFVYEKIITIFYFLCINLILSIIIGYQYIAVTKGIKGFLPFFYIYSALISNNVIFYIILFSIFFIFTLFFKKKFLLFITIIPLMFLFHIITFIDSIIYRIFKFHINGMVINLFLTEGSWDSVHFGFLTIFTFIITVLILIFFEIIIFNFLYNKFLIKKTNFPRIYYKLIIIFLLSTIIIDKTLYAVSDLYNKTEITRLSRLFPLYQPLTIKRSMEKYFGFKVDREDTLNSDSLAISVGSTLIYPKNKIIHKRIDKYPNILWIFIDAAKKSIFDEETMPNISKFSKKCIVFNNHYSGGNATRFGVFSAFYSLYGSYWHQFLGERRSPVFIDELNKLGYDFKILASTKLTYPEFRKTIFVNISEAIEDEFPGENAEKKDPQLVERFISWLSERDKNKPFFSFIFFDAPHGPYSYPEEFNKFKPSKKNANYITVTEKEAKELKNSYKNAVYFDDYLTGKIINYLEEKKYLDNTIVVITSDHGEEFYESGYLGHTSAFSEDQTKVPLVIYVPGMESKNINKLTSHLDLVPTMFYLLGYEGNIRDYSLGNNLFSKEENDFIISSGWDNAALIDNDNIIVFSLETYNMGLFEIRDKNYKLVEDYKSILKSKQDKLKKAIYYFSDFTRK